VRGSDLAVVRTPEPGGLDGQGSRGSAPSYARRMIEAMRAGEMDEVVVFVARQQADVGRRIAYVGVDAAGIRGELDGLEPEWTTTARVVREPVGGRLVGAVVAEWDEELGRAWVIGPWVHADDDTAWLTTAEVLVDAALGQTPEAVTHYELSGDVAHRRLAELAAGRGWRATEVNHVLVADAAVVEGWGDGDAPNLRAPEVGDLAAITALHDAEFPGTYASADQLLDGKRVVLGADDGGRVAGYAAGEVHGDGEGYVDFLAVDPALRRGGVGRRLVVALTRELLGRSPLGRVALTVQDHRAPARALYERLGFRAEGSIVGYRSWTAP
jgi:ribosomal protein S18 acetylase RimI-like enzyme